MSHGCLSCHHHRDAIERPLPTAGWSDTREHLSVSNVKLELEEGVDNEVKNASLTVIYAPGTQLSSQQIDRRFQRNLIIYRQMDDSLAERLKFSAHN